VNINEDIEKLYAVGIVVIMTGTKLLGREALEKVSTSMAVISLIPSLMFVVAGLVTHGLDWKVLGSDKVFTQRDPASRCVRGFRKSSLLFILQ